MRWFDRYVLCGALLALLTTAARADNLVYQFKGAGQAIYRITIRAEMPDSIMRRDYYVAFVPVASGDQIELPYQIVSRNSELHGQAEPDPFVPQMSLFDTPSADAAPRINSAGKIIRVRNTHPDQAPFALGPAWELALPMLGGGNTWNQTTPSVIDEKPINPQQPAWPPRPLMMRPEGSDTLLSANRVTQYNAGDPQGSEVHVRFHTDLATDDKVNDKPIEHQYGDGEFVFDTQRGLVKSLSEKLTHEINIKNVVVTLPLTVKVDLLESAEVAKLKADADAEHAKQADAVAKMQQQQQQLHARISDDLPDGMRKSEMIGATEGGGPFVAASKQHKPLIGFVLKSGDWMGEKRFRKVDPLFDPADASNHDDGDTVILAKPGYAVGAITLNAGKSINAICLTFMKTTADGLDPKQSYNTVWYGHPVNASRRRLSAETQFIYGIFGRKGLNVDALGILTESAPANDADLKDTGPQSPGEK